MYTNPDSRHRSDLYRPTISLVLLKLIKSLINARLCVKMCQFQIGQSLYMID